MPRYRFFDHASTTPCCPEAAEALELYSCAEYGNPSSAHALGLEPARAIKNARAQIARLLDLAPEQLIFTGSGTESDNLAIQGVALAALAERTRSGSPGPLPRVISSRAEHAAVCKTIESLADLGFDVQWVPLDAHARVLPQALESLLTPETLLVSVQTVNNVLGTVQPVAELARLVKTRVPRAVFHTDAVQALGKVPLPRASDGVDLLSLSAHKIEGPKGIGALAVLNPELLRGSRVRPLVWGGGQESGLRSGTQSAALVVAFERALARKWARREQESVHAQALGAELARTLDARVGWNSPLEGASPFVLNLDLRGFPAGAVARALEHRGFCVSTGSACSSAKGADGDPVLLALGRKGERASGLRVSFGPEHTVDDVRELSRALTASLDEAAALFGAPDARA